MKQNIKPEPVLDITEILEQKAEILRDAYRPITNGRQVLLDAKEEIERLRAVVEEQKAEIMRLDKQAKY